MDTRIEEPAGCGETPLPEWDLEQGARSYPLVITVSGERCAGREEVAAYLAEQLGLPCYDEPLLERLVDASLADASKLERKGVPCKGGSFDGWLHKLISSGNSKQQQRILHLVKVVLEIGARGGVIIGSGAHLILANLNVFRLKVEGGVDHCARRIAKREGISFEKARVRVRECNTMAVSKVREVYHNFPTENTYYDLVLNAESLNDLQMMKLSWLALKQTGRLSELQYNTK